MLIGQIHQTYMGTVITFTSMALQQQNPPRCSCLDHGWLYPGNRHRCVPMISVCIGEKPCFYALDEHWHLLLFCTSKFCFCRLEKNCLFSFWWSSDRTTLPPFLPSVDLRCQIVSDVCSSQAQGYGFVLGWLTADKINSEIIHYEVLLKILPQWFHIHVTVALYCLTS